jgi:hypothetical protein
MKSFFETLLIFLFTALILLIGIVFGYDQIPNPYKVPERALSISTPMEGEIDTSFLESL